jgi:hypothetical protein
MSEKGFDYWTFFAAEARRANAPLYVRLTEGVAGDEGLRAFAANARIGQPMANILFGAVHFLLLHGVEHPLRRFYRNLGGTAEMSREDPFPDFRDFVETHRADLLPIVSSRVTNTNEVGRSALLHAGFRALAAEAGEPLNLIELGPSAGLNLYWDRYGVRYLKEGAAAVEIAPGAPMVIDCEARSDMLPPAGPTPKVASRVGLERNPVDLADPANRDWLKALVWPDHASRFGLLEKALHIAAAEKPPIVAGDALDLLPGALARAPRDQPLCVYHTMVTYQFRAEAREALDHLLIAASLRRPLWRLSLEGTYAGDNPLTLHSYRDGLHEQRVLALCGPHGTWIDWRAS